MLIKNGVIHTMDGPVIDRGYVWVEGSRIAGVGGMDALPPEEHFGPGGGRSGGACAPWLFGYPLSSGDDRHRCGLRGGGCQ